MSSFHLFRSSAANIVMDAILISEPDPSTLPTTSTEMEPAHGPIFLSVVRRLHSEGMGALDILLLIPTIVQLIQQLSGDIAAIIAAIRKLRGG